MSHLSDLYNHSAANTARHSTAFMAALTAKELAAAYTEGVRDAPRRHQCNKAYFVGHAGLPSCRDGSTRREEHLAIAIFNRFRGEERLAITSGRTLRMLDYQLPLKARQGDKGVGKVDLFAVDDDGRPVVLELKVESPRSRSCNDTPLRAFLEALAYTSIVEANIGDIATELRERRGVDLKVVRPDTVVLAPIAYWTQLEAMSVMAGWRPIAERLFGEVADALQLNVDLLALHHGPLTMGSKDTQPLLIGPCTTEQIMSLTGRRTAGA
jgi:hypothetical protein